MDRRSLLAIILTFAILIAWEAFYMAPKRSELAKRRTAALEERHRADSLAALEEPVAETPATETPAARPPAREIAPSQSFMAEGGAENAERIAIVTGVARIALSSAGGEVESVTLTDFARKDGSRVELVPAGARGGMRLALLDDGEWKKLSDLPFEMLVDGVAVESGSEIVLGPERDSATVLFRRAGEGGELIERSYTFRRDSYEIGVRVAMRREGGLARTAAYSLGWECGLVPSESNVREDERKFAALGKVGDEQYKTEMAKFGKETRREYEGAVVWAGARTKYFLSALVVRGGERASGSLVLLGDRAESYIGCGISYPFRGDPRFIEDEFAWYAGPLDLKGLRSYGVGMEKAIDMGYLRALSVGILRLMVWTKKWVPNYGLIIIIISILTKLLFYRLTHKSFKSMKDMQRLQPKIKEIQEKWKGDRDRLNKEIMSAYKEAGVSPLGGCLPLLLQMPVFIALYNALGNTIELRGAPFVGWINDLSMPDTLFNWGASIPFLGSEFHLLPILMGGAMVAQSRLGGSPTGDGAPAAQTKMMNYLMPIIFTVFFYGMPSGLVLYWLVNQVLSVAQQYVVQREVEAEERSRAIEGAGQ